MGSGHTSDVERKKDNSTLQGYANAALAATAISLDRLADCSLVMHIGKERYSLHPLLKAFAMELLQEAQEFVWALHKLTETYVQLMHFSTNPGIWKFLESEQKNITGNLGMVLK